MSMTYKKVPLSQKLLLFVLKNVETVVYLPRYDKNIQSGVYDFYFFIIIIFIIIIIIIIYFYYFSFSRINWR